MFPSTGGTQGYQPYAYAGNNPASWTDPSGRNVCLVAEEAPGASPGLDTACAAGAVGTTTNGTVVMSLPNTGTAAQPGFENIDPGGGGGVSVPIPGGGLAKGVGKAAAGIAAAIAGAIAGAISSTPPSGGDENPAGPCLQLTWETATSVLRTLLKTKGTSLIGRAHPDVIEEFALAWLQDNWRTSSGGYARISEDGLRQYRPPSYKPTWNSMQANFEWRQEPRGEWLGNGHMESDLTCPSN